MAKNISSDVGRIGSIASREFIANERAISVGYESFHDLDVFHLANLDFDYANSQCPATCWMYTFNDDGERSSSAVFF